MKTSKPNELYRKSENVQELLDRLRDAYIAYKESAGKCKVELKPRNAPNVVASLGASDDKASDREFRNFYLPPRIPQLDDPEKQKKFRKEYISEVGAKPETEPLTLMADVLHLEALDRIADRSRASVAREEYASFFRRHAVGLQHKKFKILGRWANQVTHAQQVDCNSTHFDRMVGRLQKELDSALSRCARLSADDAYEEAVNPKVPRPQPISADAEAGRADTLLYVEAPEKVVGSTIRQDDIEVMLRIQTYRNTLFRLPQKLAASIKWLPYSRRFDIWTESRIQIQTDKTRYNEARYKVLHPVAEQVKQRLIGAGVADEKLLHLITDKFTLHLKSEKFISRNDQALNSHKAHHEKPPFLFTSNVELKLMLVPLAQEYGLAVGEFLDVDDGH